MFYSTTFPTVETPLSEGGKWVNTVSATWNAPIQVTANGAFSTSGGTGFNDSVALLTGVWGPDQTVTVKVAGPGPMVNEVECHCRMSMVPGSPNKIFTYEFDWIPGFMQLVRWDGPQGTFTPLTASAATATIKAGDILECSVSGGLGAVVLTAKLNGSLVQTFTDTDTTNGLTSGNPGLGLEYRTVPADATNIGVNQFTATDGNNSVLVPRRKRILTYVG